MSEPILICYDGSAGFEAKPRGDAGVSQVAEHAGRSVLIVPSSR